MRISKIKKYDIANGPGIRLSVFVSGCNIHCPGCFNEEAWDYDSGEELTPNLVDEIVEELEKPEYEGISILGGEPLSKQNLDRVLFLICYIRQKFGDSKNIWLWTGTIVNENYIPRFELSLNKNVDLETRRMILCNIDYVVDGPFVEEKKDISLVFRGSSNQRILRKSVYKLDDRFYVQFVDESKKFDKKGGI